MILAVAVCDRCGARNEDRIRTQPHICPSYSGSPMVSTDIWTPPQPEGWLVIDDHLYCHTCAESFRAWQIAGRGPR